MYFVLYKSQHIDMLHVMYKSKFHLDGQNTGTELLTSHLKALPEKLPGIQFKSLKGITREP